jgi:hypothetical protein
VSTADGWWADSAARTPIDELGGALVDDAIDLRGASLAAIDLKRT